MHSYEQLRVYQDAMDLAEAIYKHTAYFPKDERYNLIDQLRRSAVSVPSNIAEGCGRSSKPDTVRFLNIALGSLVEADTQLSLSQRFNYGDAEQLKKNLVAVRRQLIAFRKHLGG